MTKSTKQHWNTYWQRAEHQQAQSAPNRKLINVLCSLGDVRNKVILEVGAGTGRDSAYLASLGAMTYALDYSPQALILVNSLLSAQSDKLLPVAGDAFRLPFPDNSVDFIFHQGFLEHYRNPEALLYEQNRILKPGGYVIIDVPQKYTLYTLKKHLAMWRGHWFAGWETEYSPAGLEKLVAACGYELRLTYGWGMALSYGWITQKLITSLKGIARMMKWSSPHHPPTAINPDRYGTPNRLDYLTQRTYLYLADSVGVVAQKCQ